MPASYSAADRGIAADHSSSIVVDLPFGLRGGIPVYGVPFFAKALVMATEDGHPRAIAYTSRVPLPTISAINRHAFYADLIRVQHAAPLACPWWRPLAATAGCYQPPGVYPSEPILLTQGQLAAAARDAASMHIGWAVVWKRNNSVNDFVEPFLRETGFRFAYRTCGKDSVLIYQRTAATPASASGPCLR
jgi:hypothetical protein